MTDSTDAQLGSVTISPDTGEVGTWGTWVAAFTVGAGGIATGGGIQMSLPVRWHQWIRNSARKMQTTDPTDAFYVSARTSRSDVTLRCELADATEVEFPKMNRMNLGGWRPMSRFGWTVCVTVQEGSLEAGDTVEVVYGDTSQGGRGFTPPLYAGSPELVHAAVDSTGDGEHLMLPDESLPLLSHTPGSPVELLIVLPTNGVVGEPAKLRMVALDEFHNPVALPDTPVHLVVDEGSADIEQSPANLGDAGTLGSRTLTITPTGAGVLRVRGTSVDGQVSTRSRTPASYPPTPRPNGSTGETSTPTPTTRPTAPAPGTTTSGTPGTARSWTSTAPPTTTTPTASPTRGGATTWSTRRGGTSRRSSSHCSGSRWASDRA